ncbi:MAG: sulfotransferase, partial [Candidatus Heimdallarchaeota archaeon]|nr:sulfotransferase [Candidatus Heimdallarchaeota archaeon]
LPESFLLAAWKQAIYQPLRKTQIQNRKYIDSNNHLYAIAVLWPELYPNLKIIHIVRDPRTYIRSHLNWSRGRFKSFIANYLTPFWQPTAYLLKDMRLSEWIKLSKIERFAWIWNYKNNLIAQISKSQTPYLCIRFEDLFENPHPQEIFNHMLDFIDLPECDQVEKYFQTSINASKKRKIPSWKQWPDELCRSILRLCSEGMELFGYGTEPVWIMKTKADGVGS